MSEHISLRELARRLGRSAPSLGELAKKGVIPRNADGTYDEAAVRAAYAKNATPGQRKPLKGDAPPAPAAPVASTPAIDESLIRRVLAEEGRAIEGPPSYDDVRTAEMILKTRKSAQEIAVNEGELIRKAPVLRHIEETFAGYRKELQALPARYGAQIAAEAGCDVSALDRALTKVIREHLDGLSAPVVRT